MTPSDNDLRANADERLIEPSTPAQRGLQRYLGPLAGIILYALLITFLVIDSQWEPFVTPPEQVIPVEILTEPPPEPQQTPPPPQPQADPAPKSLDEDPAYDAPKVGKSEKDEDNGDKAAQKSPEVAEHKPNPDPPQDKPATPTQGDPNSTTPAAGPLAEKSDEAIEPSGMDPSKSEPPQGQPDVEPTTEPPAPKKTAALPYFASVPDVDFEGMARAAELAHGNAKRTYLTTIYGMIMPHLKVPSGSRAGLGSIEGVIVFTVDGSGNLIDSKIVRSSGSRELDKSALDAIAKASPFPSPPTGQMVGMRFSYGAR
jgi:TonB family protein